MKTIVIALVFLMTLAAPLQTQEIDWPRNWEEIGEEGEEYRELFTLGWEFGLNCAHGFIQYLAMVVEEDERLKQFDAYILKKIDATFSAMFEDNTSGEVAKIMSHKISIYYLDPDNKDTDYRTALLDISMDLFLQALNSTFEH